jgi:oligopeptidase B
MERGMRWWKEGKMLNKKNTFSDFISCAKFLIQKKYTSKKKIIAFGGSAGGLLLGSTINQIPDLLLGAIMAVPFVDNLTTNMDHSLPLTKGELLEFGDAKNNKKHFEYIRSYAPYDNLEKKDYPHILITTSLSDSRVLFDEPTKYCAKLRDLKTNNNLLLLKCEMDAGHGGKSGRTAAIEEIAFDYAFALKIAGI